MAKRLLWMGTGYVAGAASSWMVKRKVRTVTEQVMPEAFRGDTAQKFMQASMQAKDQAKGIAANANEHLATVKERVRPQGEAAVESAAADEVIDLREDAPLVPSLESVRKQLDMGRISDSPAVARLRERSSRYGR